MKYNKKYRVLVLGIFKTCLEHKEVTYYLRNETALEQPGSNTITYRLNSFSYNGTILWNDLINDVKSTITVDEFNILIM